MHSRALFHFDNMKKLRVLMTLFLATLALDTTSAASLARGEWESTARVQTPQGMHVMRQKICRQGEGVGQLLLHQQGQTCGLERVVWQRWPVRRARHLHAVRVLPGRPAEAARARDAHGRRQRSLGVRHRAGRGSRRRNLVPISTHAVFVPIHRRLQGTLRMVFKKWLALPAISGSLASHTRRASRHEWPGCEPGGCYLMRALPLIA